MSRSISDIGAPAAESRIAVSSPPPTRIGILGGTFDPVHIGHLIIAADLQLRMQLDQVLFVPAGAPPHKNASLISRDEDRVAMLKLALADEPYARLSRVDLDRPGPSYSVDMLCLLKQQHPDAALVFLMGEDSLRDFPGWREPERILAMAEIGVAARPRIEADLPSIYERLPTARGRILLSPALEIGISSSTIRQRVADGEPIRHMTPAAVEAYIRRHGLYRNHRQEQ